jgi:hypothetical protein
MEWHPVCCSFRVAINNNQPLLMIQTDIDFVLELSPLFTQWKQQGYFRVTPEQGVRLRNIYQTEMGKPMPTCSTCFVEAFYSLIIRAEAQQKELAQEPTPEIKANEQPTKRRRTRK